MKPRHKLFFILPLSIVYDQKTPLLEYERPYSWKNMQWSMRYIDWNHIAWIWLRKCTCYVSAILKLKHKYQNCSDYVNVYECVNRYLMISKRIKFVFRLILRKHHQFRNKWNKTVVMSCHQRTTTNNNK